MEAWNRFCETGKPEDYLAYTKDRSRKLEGRKEKEGTSCAGEGQCNRDHIEAKSR